MSILIKNLIEPAELTRVRSMKKLSDVGETVSWRIRAHMRRG